MNGDTKLKQSELRILPPLGGQWLVWIGQELHSTTTRLEAMELFKAAKIKGRDAVVYCLTDKSLGGGP